MPYPNEHSCRLRDPDELDVVGSRERKHDGKKYRVIFGKPKSGDGSVEQAYRYPKDTWSESEAWAHCRSHNGRFEPASRETSVSVKRDQLVEYIHGKGFRRAENLVAALVDLIGEDLFSLIPETQGTLKSGSVELQFWAAVHSIETGEEKRLATFYLMNTSLNLNRWRVTDKALEDAYPTLMGKTLNCIPGYRVNHVHEPIQVGRWVKLEKPDGYVLATAEITDPVAWEKLISGEWGPVSVVIRAYRVTCSVCGGDITGGPDEHVLSGEGYEIVESFAFDRVDFVSKPAYPQSGLLTLSQLVAASAPNLFMKKSIGAAVIGRTPEFIASQSNMDGVQGPRRNLKPDETMEKKKMEAQVEELQQKLETLKASHETLKAKNEQLKTDNTNLEGRIKTLEDEKHDKLVDATLEARFKAGLVKDREMERTALVDLDDTTLILRKEDAEQFAEKLAKAPPTGPKAKYTADDKSAFEAAVEDMRERLLGHRKEAS